MVKHVVMWNIQPGFEKLETMNKLKADLEGLLGKVPSLKEIEVGFNFNNNPSGHDIILYTVFDTQEGMDEYLVHPEHVKVAQYVKSVVCDRSDVDYVS